MLLMKGKCPAVHLIFVGRECTHYLILEGGNRSPLITKYWPCHDIFVNEVHVRQN